MINPTPLIFLVEDDPLLRKLFQKTILDSGYPTETFQTAESAKKALRDREPGLIISDVVLNGRDGVWLCRELRHSPDTAHIPVILMSGHRMDEEDQVEGLDAGADDYLLKPISSAMLLAKIQCVLRRYQAPKELAEILSAHGLVLNVQSRMVRFRNNHIPLTRKEFDLLTAFLRSPGEVLTIPSLLKGIWGIEPSMDLETHTLKVHISSLRNKLGPRIGDKITNVPREGYRFEKS